MFQCLCGQTTSQCLSGNSIFEHLKTCCLRFTAATKSFFVLFDSYKKLLSQKDAEDQKEDDPEHLLVSSSDLQQATKKMFSIAVQQDTETLNKVSFYDSLCWHFIVPSELLRCKLHSG